MKYGLCIKLVLIFLSFCLSQIIIVESGFAQRKSKGSPLDHALRNRAEKLTVADRLRTYQLMHSYKLDPKSRPKIRRLFSNLITSAGQNLAISSITERINYKQLLEDEYEDHGNALKADLKMLYDNFDYDLINSKSEERLTVAFNDLGKIDSTINKRLEAGEDRSLRTELKFLKDIKVALVFVHQASESNQIDYIDMYVDAYTELKNHYREEKERVDYFRKLNSSSLWKLSQRKKKIERDYQTAVNNVKEFLHPPKRQ